MLRSPIESPIGSVLRSALGLSSGLRSRSPIDIASCRILLDASDSSTLFQNADGTNPVTALGQSIPSWRDLSANQTLFVPSPVPSNPLRGRIPKTGIRNLLYYTRAFDNAFWTKAGAGTAVSANATTGPDGTTTADRITLADVSGSAIRRSSWSMRPGATFTLSCYFKNNTCGSGETFEMVFRSSTVAPGDFVLKAVVDCFNKSATFSLTGTATTGISGAASGSVTDVGDGWFRVQVTGTAGTSVGWDPVGIVELVRTAGSRQFFATDIQLEQNSSATNPQIVVNGNDVTEAGVDELPTVWFSGHRLDANIDLSGTNKLTIVAAINRPVFNTNHPIINQNASASPSLHLRYGATSSFAVMTANLGTSKEGSIASLALGASSVLIGRVNGAGPFISIQQNNGTVVTTSTTLGAGNFQNGLVRIAQRTDGLNSTTNHYAALAIFTDILSTDDLNFVRTWMGEKIGLTL